MTNFSTQMVAGSAVTPFFSKEKGSMGNRFDCAGSQIVNTVKTTAQLGLVGGAAGGILYGVNKSPKFANAITKGLKAFQNLMQKNKFTSKAANFITNALKNISKNGKIGVITAAIALPIVSYITHKHSYKMGQIDQKYTDKAKFQQTL